MKRNPLPPAEYLRELFSYEPETGLLRWRVKRAQMDLGSVAGAQRGDGGYLQVSIDRKLYRVHLVIWKMVTGEEPSQQIDHRDTIKNNNRWGNLREATKSQNTANRGLTKSNTSGKKGAVYYRAYDKWASQIWKDGKAYFLGYFDTADEAHAAYMAKASELYGDYARAA